jgi:CheY-like chemotaxis protein
MTPANGTRALLTLLQQAGGLDAQEAARLERAAAAAQQPIAELLEREGIITQRDLATFLAETLRLPFRDRLSAPPPAAGTRLARAAQRATVAMVLEDALAKLAAGVVPVLPRGAKLALAPRSPAAAPRSFRALVVDDDPDLRFIVQSAIERSGLGLTVVTAKDAAEALVLVEMERPDIVILDLAMPKIDGYEVCRRLKRAARTKALPILILSATGTPESITRAKDLGADDYVVKPFRREDFIDRIRRLIDRPPGGNAAASAQLNG